MHGFSEILYKATSAVSRDGKRSILVIPGTCNFGGQPIIAANDKLEINGREFLVLGVLFEIGLEYPPRLRAVDDGTFSKRELSVFVIDDGLLTYGRDSTT